MKKASTSRLKKLPLLLGTLLIISVAAYGTRAYFSDSRTQQANIVLELGNVEISTEDSEWIPTTTGTDLKKLGKDEITKNYSFKNVKPGDFFTRQYTIKNTGSLDTKVTLEYSGKMNPAIDPLNLDLVTQDQINGEHPIKGTPFIITIKDFKNNLVLKANSGVDSKTTYTVVITVDKNASADFNINATAKEKAGNQNLDLVVSDFLKENLKITANQVATK
ncbi:MAG: TasA family protein [Carnobacterium sp.]|uniref:TasA family protein n=1 Tax=Carnobacterium sp. TaxID=48221 RepID=UPI003314509B